MLALATLATLVGLAFVFWRRSALPLIDFVLLGFARVYAALWHRCTFNRRAGLPATGPALLVANHVSSADPAFVASGSERLLSFMLAREYEDLPLFRHVFRYAGCVAVRRNGRDWVGMRQALRRLQEGRVVCIFPEGGLSYAGRPRMGRGRAGVAWLALASGVPVIPVRIEGGPRTRSVGEAWFLPSRGVRVTYGRPLDLSGFRGRRRDRKTLTEATELIMRAIASLSRSPRGGTTMTAATDTDLTQKHCAPCEGGVPALKPEQVRELLPRVSGWSLTGDGKRLRREWRVKDFVTALDFFQRVGRIAEEEDHHPDLHLTGYRNVALELSTHAVGGLTENDFILAAKINQLPVELKQ